MDLIRCDRCDYVFFKLICYNLERSEGGGGSFEIESPRSRWWKNFGHLDLDGQGGVRDLERWTILIDVICVSSLKSIFHQI